MAKFCWLVIGLMPILFGCEDMVELEKQSYVVAVGIDKTDQDGTYQFTYQIANPEAGSSLAANNADQAPSEIISIVGTDLMTTSSTANAFVTKQMVMDQTRVLIISEELARTDQFLRVIQSVARSNQIRRGVKLVISKENASQFMNNNDPALEQRPHKYYQYMLSRARETGLIPDADIHRFFQITEGDADLFLGIYATTIEDPKDVSGPEDTIVAGEIPKHGGNSTQFMGAAVFKEGIMIDVLTAEETRIANILDKTMKMDELLASYPDPVAPEYNVAVKYIQKNEPKIEINYDRVANHAAIQVIIPFEAEIIAIPSLINYSQVDSYKERLKKSIESYAEHVTRQFIKKTQEFYRAEPFYWSLYIRKFFKDIPDFEEADWNKQIYPNADITVYYQMKRMHFGKMLDDTHLNEVRD
ncbi:germination protein, Ger(x)C family [Amphibacillus marinus]|uniref:Germination protein, Ger(X)C family n=1 Tax=Amphibacillus marinus TaxID=872970 RepID=A0A1H8PCI8_9BACI|nr:Ger(x)C family spore germination C-terminal domain-containing protein [Amphibacillus marinus]SEO39699.1 germination protein, Ger(x)C family [Amphibacillus marinus]